MTIKNDAFFLLAIIYKRNFLERQDLGSDGLAEFTGFNHNRVLDAIRYLQGETLIDKEEKNIILSGVIVDLKCTSKGIEIIENPESNLNDYRIKFEVNFITNVTIDSLVKANFDGSIFKVF